MARNRNSSNGTHGEEVPKVKLTKENLKEVLLIFSYLKPYRKRFVTGLVFIALSGATTMSFPYMLKKLIDSAHEIGMGSIATPPGVIAMIMVVILGVQMIFSFSRIYLFTSVGENALADMRRDVYKRMIMMPMDFFAQRRVGSCPVALVLTCPKFRMPFRSY